MIRKNKRFTINNKNLILGAACGYNWGDLKIFVKSLRKFLNCRVILIFEEELNNGLKNRLKNYEIEYAENLEFKPQYVDLRLSSLCNLKCRMCTPFYSSQWVDEWNDLSKLVDDPVLRQLKPKEKINLKKPNWDQTQIFNENLQKLSKHANYINVSGGEPTIVKQNIDFLKYIHTYHTFFDQHQI